MDVVKESYVTEEDGEERKRWKQMISCGDPPPTGTSLQKKTWTSFNTV